MSGPANIFDAATTPLDAGVTRLEASAGTGKTYALTALVLRLIAEAGLEIGSILVTTFTKPATAELRERIRSLLRAAVEMFKSGPGTHALLGELHPGYVAREAEIRPRLERALRQFDDATIATIHGFCLGLLQERAFESGVAFDAEALEDQELLLREVAADFWRSHIYPADLRLGAFAMLAGLSGDHLMPLLRTRVSRPTMEILPAHTTTSLATAERALRAAFAAAEQAWMADESGVRAIFAEPVAWAKGEMKKVASTDARLAALDRCFAEPASCCADYQALDFFTTGNVEANTTVRGKTPPQPPSHPLFTACHEFVATREAWTIAFQREFLAWAPAALHERKLQRNVLSFDDLLTRLREALAGATGSALVAATQQRFAAALVDEFQDTDPVQAEIFERLFAGHGRLYFIGDPKQAIYGFRGADVFSYLAATKAAPHCAELATNQRSVAPLVQAVNAIFARNPQAFLVDGIDFHPVTPAARNEGKALTAADGQKPAPFQFWVWSEKETIPKYATEQRLPAVVAESIIGQLQGGLQTEGRPLRPSDFAVLTASNHQAQIVQEALLAAGLPAVVLSNALVFHSPEAAEMLALVQALATPTHEAAVRAALATTAFGHTAADLARLAEAEWERVLETFLKRHAQWLAEGFFPAFRALLVERQIRPRLLGRPDGPRRLTNFLHLAELLHHAATTERLGPVALARWLAVQMHPDSPKSEERELRLESDEEAVKVVTMHKSKGLEFGIVWCPFSWDSAELRREATVTFHQPPHHRLVLDLGSPDHARHHALAAGEQLAEKVRLLYVALTRARLQCHFVWGRFNQCANSAAAWVLHPPRVPPGEALVTQRTRELDDATLRQDLTDLATELPGAFAIRDVPEPAASRYPSSASVAPVRQAREFTRPLRRDWMIGSFSSLTAGVDPELPDYDRDAGATGPAPVATAIHAFPRGRRAGTCLHEIFEDLDFRDAASIEALVARKLEVFAFDRPDYRAAVSENVRRTLAVELAPGLRLSSVPTSARLNELEFHLPVVRLDPAQLRAVLGEDLPFSAFSGFLKGFIDLVFEHAGRFYIADWKSNWLGATADDYTPDAMAAEMRRHHYGVQYQLYTIALHRYLTRRIAGYDPARHFGGVFYVFLRGVDPARPDLGIFRDTPTPARIAALDALLSTQP